MSDNPLVDAALQVHEAVKENERLLAEKRIVQLEDLKAHLLDVFTNDITNSFDYIEMKPDGDRMYYKAVLIYDSVPIEFIIQNVSINSTCANDARLKIGNEVLASFMVTVPKEHVINNIMSRISAPTAADALVIVQEENERKLIHNLSKIVGERIIEFRKSRPFYWKNEIPRNYSGASRAKTLLPQLEAEKYFLSEEEYQEALTTLNRVILDNEIEQKRISEENALFKGIVKEEITRWEKESKEYENTLTEICKALGKQYFKPWVMYTVTYMPENFDPKDLRDDDGEIVEDVIDVVTNSTNYIGEPDSEGFVNSVDIYGSIRKRKFSSNILHIDKTEFNYYPGTPNGEVAINCNFWKKYTPDNLLHKISFAVPPGTVVEPYGVPTKPKTWEETSKERGVKDPWKYRS